MPGLDNVDLLFLVFSDVICYPEDAEKSYFRLQYVV